MLYSGPHIVSDAQLVQDFCCSQVIRLASQAEGEGLPAQDAELISQVYLGGGAEAARALWRRAM